MSPSGSSPDASALAFAAARRRSDTSKVETGCRARVLATRHGSRHRAKCGRRWANRARHRVSCKPHGQERNRWWERIRRNRRPRNRGRRRKDRIRDARFPCPIPACSAACGSERRRRRDCRASSPARPPVFRLSRRGRPRTAAPCPSPRRASSACGRFPCRPARIGSAALPFWRRSRRNSRCSYSRTGRNPAAPSPPSCGGEAGGRRRASCARPSAASGRATALRHRRRRRGDLSRWRRP